MYWTTVTLVGAAALVMGGELLCVNVTGHSLNNLRTYCHRVDLNAQVDAHCRPHPRPISRQVSPIEYGFYCLGRVSYLIWP